MNEGSQEGRKERGSDSSQWMEEGKGASGWRSQEWKDTAKIDKGTLEQ